MDKLSEAIIDREEFEVFAFRQLYHHIEVIDDPRDLRGRRYTLCEILVIAILGCLCGCDDAEALEDWGTKEESWLKTYLDLKHGTPSQDVFLRVLGSIDGEQFAQVFSHWAADLFRFCGIPHQIALDGQTYRGSKNGRSKAIHVVHAFSCEDGLSLGLRKVDGKSNEITAIPQLLDLLFVSGSLVSIDAMGCQTEIAAKIVDKRADYLLGLKGNQGTIHKESKKLFALLDEKNEAQGLLPTYTECIQTEGGHGRIEERRCRIVSEHNVHVPSAGAFTELHSIIEIKSKMECPTTGKVTKENRYYLTSRDLSPEEAIEATRNHWRIENQLHWCMDVSFGQDAYRGRSKNLAQNFGVIRQFALNLLRNSRVDRFSIPRKRRKCDYSVQYREKVLGLA